MTLKDFFARISRSTAHAMGHPMSFVIAVAVIIVWGLTGPLFGWSDTWQLIINTGTTIVTFLMVFVIQNTQNRDGEAVQLKLDELIRATKKARNAMLDLEECSEAELEEFRKEFQRIAEKRKVHLKKAAEEASQTKAAANHSNSKG